MKRSYHKVQAGFEDNQMHHFYINTYIKKSFPMISLTQARFITIGENIFFDILIYIKLTKNYAVPFFFLC